MIFDLSRTVYFRFSSSLSHNYQKQKRMNTFRSMCEDTRQLALLLTKYGANFHKLNSYRCTCTWKYVGLNY